MAEIGEFRVALTVDDFEGAVSFYRDAVGLPQIEDWTSEDGRVVLLDAGRATLEILDESQAEYVDRVEVGTRVAGAVRLAFAVEDVDGVAAALVDAGATEEGEVVTTPWQDRNARLRVPGDMQLTLFSPDAG